MDNPTLHRRDATDGTQEWNIAECEICGTDASYNRVTPTLPPEGSLCSRCHRWVCPAHEAVTALDDPICTVCKTKEAK